MSWLLCCVADIILIKKILKVTCIQHVQEYPKNPYIKIELCSLHVQATGLICRQP